MASSIRTISPLQRRTLYESQQGKCHYCFAMMNFPKDIKRNNLDFTVDHIRAVSKGGKKSNNLVGACHGCNQRKGNLPYSEFIRGLNLPMPSTPLISLATCCATVTVFTCRPYEVYCFRSYFVGEPPRRSYLQTFNVII